MVGSLDQFAQAGCIHGKGGKRLRVIAQRMTGNIESGHVFFKAEHGAQVIFRNIRQGWGHVLEHAVAEERHLSADIVAAVMVRAIQRAFVDSHELGALCAGAVHSTGENERFDDALVDLFGVHPLAEIENILVCAALSPLLDDGVDGFVAAGLDGAQAEADTADALRVFADGEFANALVDVRRKKGDVVLAAILRVFRDLAAVGGDGVEQGGEELNGVMLLEPARSHGDHAVSRRVGFVERIGSERRHFVKQLAGDFRADAVAHTARNDDLAVLLQAVDEDFALLCHDVVLLFRHGAATKSLRP